MFTTRYDIILKVKLGDKEKTFRATDIANEIKDTSVRSDLEALLQIRAGCKKFVSDYKKEIGQFGAVLVDYRIVPFERAEHDFYRQYTAEIPKEIRKQLRDQLKEEESEEGE